MRTRDKKVPKVVGLLMSILRSLNSTNIVSTSNTKMVRSSNVMTTSLSMDIKKISTGRQIRDLLGEKTFMTRISNLIEGVITCPIKKGTSSHAIDIIPSKVVISMITRIGRSINKGVTTMLASEIEVVTIKEMAKDQTTTTTRTEVVLNEIRSITKLIKTISRDQVKVATCLQVMVDL